LRIKAIHPALSFPVASIELNGNVTGLELRAPSGGVSGTVSTATQSVGGAVVAAYPMGDGASGRTALFTTTSANGSYSLLGLAAGSYLLTSATEGFARTTRQITIEDSAISQNIALGPESILTGSVQSSFSAEGLSGVPVWAVPTGSPEADPGQGTLTDNEGYFTIGGLEAGEYTVYAAADGYVLYSTPDVTLVQGANPPPLSIILSVSGSMLSGAVLDGSGTVPLPGVSLVFFRDGIESSRVRTDSDGRYSTDPLAPGEYDVEIVFGGPSISHPCHGCRTPRRLGERLLDFFHPPAGNRIPRIVRGQSQKQRQVETVRMVLHPGRSQGPARSDLAKHRLERYRR
jgi:hypothetical protein